MPTVQTQVETSYQTSTTYAHDIGTNVSIGPNVYLGSTSVAFAKSKTVVATALKMKPFSIFNFLVNNKKYNNFFVQAVELTLTGITGTFQSYAGSDKKTDELTARISPIGDMLQYGEVIEVLNGSTRIGTAVALGCEVVYNPSTNTTSTVLYAINLKGAALNTWATKPIKGMTSKATATIASVIDPSLDASQFSPTGNDSVSNYSYYQRWLNSEITVAKKITIIKSNSNGSIYGAFTIPNKSVPSGDVSFVLTDGESEDDLFSTTTCSSIYSSKWIINNFTQNYNYETVDRVTANTNTNTNTHYIYTTIPDVPPAIVPPVQEFVYPPKVTPIVPPVQEFVYPPKVTPVETLISTPKPKPIKELPKIYKDEAPADANATRWYDGEAFQQSLLVKKLISVRNAMKERD